MTRAIVYGVSLILTVACKRRRQQDLKNNSLTSAGTVMTIASIALPRWVSYAPVRFRLFESSPPPSRN